MEKVRHLAKVMQPTDWVNSMVVSSRGENIRNCLDPADLNKAFKHEHYPIPTVEEIVAKIPDATVLDATSGYLQMKLDYGVQPSDNNEHPDWKVQMVKTPFWY